MKVEINRMLSNRTWLSTFILKRVWRKYEKGKSQSNSNMLLYNYLTAHSETRALMPCLVFIVKQVREDGVKVLMLKVHFFNHGSHSWEGQNILGRILDSQRGLKEF